MNTVNDQAPMQALARSTTTGGTLYRRVELLVSQSVVSTLMARACARVGPMVVGLGIVFCASFVLGF